MRLSPLILQSDRREMTPMRKSRIAKLSIPTSLLRETEKLARRERRSKSEVVRDALRMYLILQSDDGFLGGLRKRATALRIRSEDDIERIVDEVRK